jgi:hypothetical protein
MAIIGFVASDDTPTTARPHDGFAAVSASDKIDEAGRDGLVDHKRTRWMKSCPPNVLYCIRDRRRSQMTAGPSPPK